MAEVQYGTEGADSLGVRPGSTTSDEQATYGLGGDDFIEGGYASDYLNGGEGKDVIWGDTPFPENEAIGDDTIDGEGGDDRIFGFGGVDNINGGTGNDYIDAGAGNDFLFAGAGRDVLIGGAGNDQLYADGVQADGLDELYGGEGDDTYFLGRAYAAFAAVDNGYDTVVISDSISLRNADGSDYTAIEAITLTGTGDFYAVGNSLANTIRGNSGGNALFGYAGSDTLYGNDGADQLDGGTGYDLLIGGKGDDRYVVNDSDGLLENPNEGTDTVVSSLSWALAANFENLQLVGPSAINGFGNELANVITGNRAANYLQGYGGIDTLIGGAGDDTYVLDDLNKTAFFYAYDSVVESANAGVDTVVVRAIVNPDFFGTSGYTLGDNVENGTISGTGAFNLFGNSLANTLRGNDSANFLSGLAGADTLDGGVGVDSLSGGIGDDTYILNDLNKTGFFYAYDGVSENANEGVDTVVVRAIVNPDFFGTSGYTLGANVENGTISGTGQFNLFGNSLANTLRGDDSVNFLSGLDGADTLDGGAGVDSLSGGIGDDTYILNDLNKTGFFYAYDGVSENANEGVDTVVVRAIVNPDFFGTSGYTLGANVENGTISGTGAFNLFGNSLANTLRGNDGANFLSGLEGDDLLDGRAGADDLRGGGGDDRYFVDNAGDTVTEAANDGFDHVYASVSETLSTNVEALTLSGTAAIDGAGNALDNILIGNAAANGLSGGAGADRIRGGLGADRITGGTGADVIGYTTLSDSTFAIGGRDQILEFRRSDGDKIDLSALDANANVANDQAFAFIGTQAFHHVAGELRYIVADTSVVILADVNGDAAADFALTLRSGAVIANDFIL